MGKHLEKLEKRCEELQHDAEYYERGYKRLEKEIESYREQITEIKFGNNVERERLYEEIIELQKGKIELLTKWLKYYEERDEKTSKHREDIGYTGDRGG